MVHNAADSGFHMSYNTQ